MRADKQVGIKIRRSFDMTDQVYAWQAMLFAYSVTSFI